jgi:hypothetical protein
MTEGMRMATADSQKRPVGRWQYGLRAGMLLVSVLAVVLGIVSLKLRQDARFQTALASLDRLGMTHGVSGAGLALECRRAHLSDEGMHELIEQLELVGYAHDLGFSAGVPVASIQLRGAKVSRAALEELRQAFPSARIDE